MRAPYLTGLLASEISRLTRYVDELITLDTDSPETQLVDQIACAEKRSLPLESFSVISNPAGAAHCLGNHAVLLDTDLSRCFDIQELFLKIKQGCSRSTRLIVITENYFLRECKSLFDHYLRGKQKDSTSLSRIALRNLAHLSGFEVVRERPIAFIPHSLGGVGTFINSALTSIPFVRRCALYEVSTLRPIIECENQPSISIVIPARDERENIRPALERLPQSLGEVEIIFVEGHSSDGTWEEIKKVESEFNERYRIKSFQQTGVGKADAVRLGFSHAKNDLLTILDADLTMPPELLPRFYNAYVESLGDFINGNRLLYPMESEAMRFLNRIGNGFFAGLLSFVLEQQLGDSLCGTKMFSRVDYSRMVQWREDFGDFDPFGDFELLFPAATLGLGIVDVPIRYRDRVYGSTSIHRFRHGLMLLRMAVVGFLKIRAG
jgi:hypothetical protein